MKKILNDYKEQIKYFISDKRYCIIVSIVMCLSYGFAVTHYSIGMDDLAFDRYVHGTYILSAKRWGTWGLYNLLQINEFTPFWLDAVVAIFMVIIATVLCAFLRKQYGDKIKIWGYILFASLIISNPLSNHFFIYQSTNLAIVISNLMVIICAITIFENYFDKNKMKINIISGLILAIPISMYESCAQTYLVVLFATIFIKSTLLNSEVSGKKLFKYFCMSIGMLLIGIIIYLIIGQILVVFLDKYGLLHRNYAFNRSRWVSKDFLEFSMPEKLWIINKFVLREISIVSGYIPVVAFGIFSIIVICVEIIKLIRTSKSARTIGALGIIFSNFILIAVFLTVLYRMQFSWIVSTGFLGLYVYQSLENRNVLKYISRIAAVLLIIIQTRSLNQYFYNDYKRYEKEKIIANDIAINVMKNCDYKNKPLLCIIQDETKGRKYRINSDNGYSLIKWGVGAFEEYQTELTKFINEQGYNFLYITDDDANAAYTSFYELDEERKKEYIVELENVIIVNMDYYEY